MKKNKENNKPEVGSFKAIIKLVKELFGFIKDIPKSKTNDENEMKKQKFAIIITILIVIVICVSMWFIPFTNEFIKELLFMK